MICPVELANEVSGLSGTLSSSMTRCRHEATERSRSGAGNESTRSDHAGDEQRDRLVSGRGDHRHQSTADADDLCRLKPGDPLGHRP